MSMNGVFIFLGILHTLPKRQVHFVNKNRGKQSYIFENPPVIAAWSSIVGKKEGEGPLCTHYDKILTDPYCGEKTWEQAEKKLQQLSFSCLMSKSGYCHSDIRLVLSGDLLNQCVGSSQSIKNSGLAHLGLYGACATMAEGLLIGAMLVDGGFVDNVVAMSSSHFAASERQYRFPLDYGGQRTRTAQWTVTGAGSVLLQNCGTGPRITSCTVGTIIDRGVKDANNMGAAMAPAALETIKAHFSDLNRSADYYDLIVTGDLGQIGKQLLIQLAQTENLAITANLTDCGCLVFDNTCQDVHAGGSGCGCSAVGLCGYLLDNIQSGRYRRVLFCGTGALLSPTSIQQGLSIPGVCHAISIECEGCVWK